MSIAHDILPECFVDTNIVNTFLTMEGVYVDAVDDEEMMILRNVLGYIYKNKYKCDEKILSSFFSMQWSMTVRQDSTKLQRELGWEPSLQFEEGIEKTVQWYPDNQEWMDNVTSGYSSMQRRKVPGMGEFPCFASVKKQSNDFICRNNKLCVK